MPLKSVISVEIDTVYIVLKFNCVVNFKIAIESINEIVGVFADTAIDVLLTVEDSIFSEKTIITESVIGMFVALFIGEVEMMVGGVVSLGGSVGLSLHWMKRIDNIKR